MYKSLEESPLFRGLESPIIEELLNKYTYSIKKYEQGDVIAQKDTAYSSLMIIVEGAVLGEMTGSNDNVVSVDKIKSPNLISPAFLFGGYNRLPIDVLAAEDGAVIMTIHRASLFGLMQENPVILSNFIDVISNRANLLTKKLFFLSFKSLKQKVGEYLVNKTFKNEYPTDIHELVKYFEATQVSIERILSDFEKIKAIKTDGGDISVTDVKILKTYIE